MLTQLLICAALGASAVLYVHYLSPADSDFCGPQSGCEVVRQSGLSYFFGSKYISLPLLAMICFSALLGLSLRVGAAEAPLPAGSRSALSRLWRRPELTLFAGSGVGAVAALALLAHQLIGLNAVCWLCAIVDLAAIAAAAAAFALAVSARHGGPPARSPLCIPAWLALGALLILAPIGWDAVKGPAPVPGAIAALYQPGKINVVEFADFECPYCRRLHALLDPIVEEHGTAVHFLRLHRPLEQHPHAELAARAAICAEEQGRGEPMADALFAENLSERKIVSIAERLRLDPTAFDACMRGERATRELERHAALLPDEELRGLPTLYVGSQRFIGVPTESELRDAFQRAARPPAYSPSGPLYVAALVALGALVAVLGRRRGA